MRILVSLLNYRPGCIGGTETYLRELLPAMGHVLEQSASEDTLMVMLHQDNALHIDLPANVQTTVLPLSDRSLVLRRSAEALGVYRDRFVAKQMASFNPDVVLFPQQSIYPGSVKAKSVMVVHDLLHLLMPHTLGMADRIYRACLYNRSLKRADHVIAISQDTAAQLQQLCHMSDERMTVIPHGYAPPSQDDAAQLTMQESAELARLPEGFLYYPAASHPHKNHDALLTSLEALKASGQWDGLLVLSGIQTPYWKRLHRHIDMLDMHDHVLHLGYVSYAMVRQLYAHAGMVVFPSRHEGFGLPVLEAVSLGCRLVTSRISVFEELGVPEHARIDFDDPQQLGEALKQEQPTVLTRKPQTWEQTAEATLAVLRQTAGLSSHITPHQG